MKKTLLLLLFSAVSFGLFAQKEKAANVELKTYRDSVNYAFGMNLAYNLKRALDTDLNLDVFRAGFQGNRKVGGTKKPSEEATRGFNEYDTKVTQPRNAARWKDDNAKFLEDNKKRPGVITTATGLQYEFLTKGTGTVSPKATDKVEVHYHGTLINGEVFDSSVKRGKTSSFALNQVIPGWTEGLQYMKEGDKVRFYIPYNLAYGEQPRGAIIKGFSTLIFDVELFKVMPTDGAQSSATAQGSTATAQPAGSDKAAGMA